MQQATITTKKIATPWQQFLVCRMASQHDFTVDSSLCMFFFIVSTLAVAISIVCKGCGSQEKKMALQENEVRTENVQQAKQLFNRLHSARRFPVQFRAFAIDSDV
jgi:hypothetical protein